MSKSLYLETWGCQMNVLDSELVLGQLRAMGYQLTDDYQAADVVLLNTCSVRQHAEDKVYSRLGEVRKARQRRPGMIVGVIGCMAERDNDGIRQRAPYVDLLCGPGNLNQIPALIAEVEQTRTRAVALEHDHSRKTPAAQRTLLYDSIEALDMSRVEAITAATAGAASSRSGLPDGTGPVGQTQPAVGTDPARQAGPTQAYIRVQRGCDKFCTFCVVPFTRGPERSRDPAHIVEEARKLADVGTKEITLLGQTVNSYSYHENGRTVRFADLLQRVHDVPGIERIRCVTSYPGDFTDDILEAMRDLPKVCEYLHIPAQSGSNDVLRRMKRQYSVEQYLDLIDRARSIVPGISLASDFIVGFCGERPADHERTLALIERVAYKNIFMFKYSNRPGTAADRRLVDDIPEAVKQERLMDLVALQHRMSIEHHRGFIGRRVEVLVEGYSKAAIAAQEAEQSRGHEVSWKRSDQLTGRTRGDEIVVFTGPASLIGRLVRVEITAATALTLHGLAGPGGVNETESLVRLPLVI